MVVVYSRTDVWASNHVNARQMPPHEQSRPVFEHHGCRVEVSVSKRAVELPVVTAGGKAPGRPYTHWHKPNEIPAGPIRWWCLWRVPAPYNIYAIYT